MLVAWEVRVHSGVAGSYSCQRRQGKNSRQSSFGHLDARTIQVFLQSTIQFRQAAVLKVRHALFVVLDVAARAKFVGRHFESELGVVLLSSGWAGDGVSLSPSLVRTGAGDPGDEQDSLVIDTDEAIG